MPGRNVDGASGHKSRYSGERSTVKIYVPLDLCAQNNVG